MAISKEAATALVVLSKLTTAYAQADPQVESLLAAIDDATTTLATLAPPKADGSAYTPDELHAMALDAQAVLDDVIDRDSKPHD